MLISIFFEALFSYIDEYPLWQWICFRYLMILYFGYEVATKGVKINITTIFLSIFGIICIMIFQYSGVNFEPFFYNNPWTIYHWPIYGFVAYLLILFLYKAYQKGAVSINHYLMLMGKYSYEIFLFQMLVYFVTDITIRGKIMDYSPVTAIIYMVAVTILSIHPVVLYKEKMNNVSC